MTIGDSIEKMYAILSDHTRVDGWLRDGTVYVPVHYNDVSAVRCDGSTSWHAEHYHHQTYR